MNTENYGSCQIQSPRTSLHKTNYQASDDYERLSDTKADQRKKILNFLLKNSEGDIKYTGLPGKFWIMEREILRMFPDAHYSGFEKNAAIYHKTKFIMPGKHKIISKSKPINDHVKLDIHVNGNGCYVLGGINDLTEKQIHLLLHRESGTFTHGFTNRNMIWYDFTSSFNEQTFRAVHDVNKIANRKAAVCFTFLFGRDMYFNGTGEEARIEIIQKSLPNFKCLDYWKYKGFNGSTMFNVCGVLGKG